MMRASIGFVAVVALAVAACGPTTTTDTGAGTPEAGAAPTTDMSGAAPAASTMAAPAAGPSAADLTVDQLPGEKVTGEIQTTPSGLRYVVVQEGSGDKPAADSRVSVHYSGYLTDGTKFDSSVDRGAPAEFQVNGVIAGWTEALQLMSPGGKMKLIIPSDLGYGPVGNGPIPPNAVLVFDVELLEVK